MARYFRTAGGTFDVSNQEGLYSFFVYCQEHPEDSEALQLLSYYLSMPAVANHYRQWQEEQERLQGAQASGDINNYYYDAATHGATPNDVIGKAVDNSLAQQNTEADRSYQTGMRDTSLLSTADQLSQLGLSTSNVISLGGASSGVTSGAASQNMHSAASLAQQAKLNAFNNKMGLAKSLISAAGSMASSGIYGAALGAVKNAGAKTAAAAAHSGLSIFKGQHGVGPSMADDKAFMSQWNKLPGEGI